MPPQEVGVRAIFDTVNFNAGLKKYIEGVEKAEQATARAVAAMNAIAIAANSGLGATTQHATATTLALQAMATAAQAAGKSLRKAGGAVLGQAATAPNAALERELEINKLIQAELRGKVALIKAVETSQNASATAIQRELGLLEAQNQVLERSKRALRFTALGVNPADLARIQAMQPSQADSAKKLGGGATSLERELELNRMIQAELRDRITLAKAIEGSTNRNATAAQRQADALQAANIILERQRRLAEFVRLGGDPARLAQVNALMLTGVDLGRRANDQLLRQVEISTLLQAEVRARIELERLSNVLNDKRSSQLQIQTAKLQMQTLEIERQLRVQQARQLGIPNAQIANIQNAKVQLADFGKTAKAASGPTQGLTARTVALGTAMGTLASGIITRLSFQIVEQGRKVLDTVKFFEQLELGIGFFAARSAQAEGSTLSYAESIESTKEEAQGLMVWLQRLAVASPFTTRDVGALFRTSQAYGLLRKEAEVLTPLLLDFAAAAGLDRDVLERLALAIGQVRARGKLTGEEVRQLGNSGVPIRDILVKTLHIANEEFDELLESGALTSNIVMPAIIKAFKQFEGAGATIAFGTIGGIVSAFEELQEIGTAKFFRAALDPLKKSIQEFFAVANDPKVLATIQVLGEELGKTLAGAFKSLRSTIQGAIEAWQAMDPAVVRQIVVFGGAVVVILGVAAAFGLMVAAINILMTPVVGLTLLTAFLISEWTSGFAVMRSVTASAVGGLTRMLGSLASFGVSAMASLASGIVDGAGVIAEAFSIIARIFTFWLSPGSPPKIAPHIDDWGEATIGEYIKGFGHANVRKQLKAGFTIVSDNISAELINARKKAVAKYNQANPDLKLTLEQDLQEQVTNAAKAAFAPTATTGAETAAGEAGIRVSEAYINGFGHMIRKLIPIVDPELTKALALLGSGRQLATQGAQAFSNYLKGFNEADFGVLEQISSIVEGFLQNLVDQGELSEGDMLRSLFGTRADIAKAIGEFRRTGKVSSDTMEMIVKSSGEAGASVRDLLTAYTQFSLVDQKLVDAQTKLTDITKKYTETLHPLRLELERISNLRQTSDEEQEIQSLRRLIANEAVSEFRKSNARLKIAEILLQRQVRGLESKQTVEEETAQTEVDAAKKAQEAAQKQLAIITARIQSQMQQLGLVGQEAQLVARLTEEIKKLREQAKTGLDLQVELIKLQKAELGDVEKAAKAKYILDKADSSELEKQNAILDLQEVALGRQQRILEARKLGIPEEELTKLYNFEVTLDDLGIKVKDDFSALGLGLDGITESTVNATAEAKKWEEQLRLAREQIGEIKKNLSEMFRIIDESLPTWLKIFPEKAGEEPPIITTLKAYKEGILAIGVAIVVSKILGGLGSMWLWFHLMGLGGAAGAAGAIPAVTTAIGGFVAALGSTFLVGVAGAVLAISGLYSWAWSLAKIFEWLRANPFGKTMISSAVPLPNLMEDLETDFTVPDSFTKDLGNSAAQWILQAKLADIVRTTVEEGVGLGLDDSHIATMVGTALADGVNQGMLIKNDNMFEAARDYMLQLIAVYRQAGEIESPSKLSGREVGVPFGQGILDGALSVLSDGSLSKILLGGALQSLAANVTTAMADMGVKLAITFDDIYLKLTTRAGEIHTEVNTEVTGLSRDWKLSALLLETALRLRFGTIKSDATTRTTEMADALSLSWGDLKTDVLLKATALKDGVVLAFLQMKTGVETYGNAMYAFVTELFSGAKGKLGLVAMVEQAMLGSDGLRPFTLGANFMIGIAQGITSQQQTLATAFGTSMMFALQQTAQEVEMTMPGRMNTGGGTGLLDQTFAAQPSKVYPGNTTNLYQTRNYFLTVQSQQSAQGVIADFGIMQTLAPG